MSYAIELCFDPHSEKILHHFWDILCQHNLSKYFCELPGGRPHISLAIYHPADVQLIIECLKSAVKNRKSMKLVFNHLGIFPTEPRSIIFVAPAVTDELFQLHKEYHALAAALFPYEWEHYKPDRWVPHCTLANDIKKEDVAKVMDVLLPVFQPFEATITEIELVEFLPVKSIMKIALC